MVRSLGTHENISFSSITREPFNGPDKTREPIKPKLNGSVLGSILILEKPDPSNPKPEEPTRTTSLLQITDFLFVVGCVWGLTRAKGRRIHGVFEFGTPSNVASPIDIGKPPLLKIAYYASIPTSYHRSNQFLSSLQFAVPNELVFHLERNLLKNQ
ncbi:hypothetical protein R6Q59_025439 [Mikania micrantha]